MSIIKKLWRVKMSKNKNIEMLENTYKEYTQEEDK